MKTFSTDNETFTFLALVAQYPEYAAALSAAKLNKTVKINGKRYVRIS